MKTLLDLMDDSFWFSVRGVTFGAHPANLRRLWENKRFSGIIEVQLNHDTSNAFDPYALQVWCNGLMIGFVPRQHNRQLLEYGLSNLKVIFRGFHFFDGRAVGASISCKKVRDKKAQRLTQQKNLVKKLTTTPRRIEIN